MPDASFVVWFIGPQTMLDDGIARSDPHADEIVRITIWKSFDVQINWRALDFQFWLAGDVDLALPNGQGFQGMAILLALASVLFRPPTRGEGVGQLGDGKDALSMELLSFLRCHAW